SAELARPLPTSTTTPPRHSRKCSTTTTLSSGMLRGLMRRPDCFRRFFHPTVAFSIAVSCYRRNGRRCLPTSENCRDPSGMTMCIRSPMRHKLLRVFLISFTFFAVSSVGLLPAKKLSDGAELFRAIREGNIDVVKSHLTKSDLAVRDGRGATPLMHAAAFGNLETLKLLLDVGADVN